MGENELYFCCYQLVALKQLGKSLRYQPSIYEGQVGESSAPGRLQLFLESGYPRLNLTLVGPI